MNTKQALTRSSKTKVKELINVSHGQKTSDGDGVNMTRLIGTPELNTIDPFLLLDAFGSDKPNDYIGGFPPHPHRGFETVTYLLHGKMRHKDNAGNEGVIESGGVQWMTAGKGIVHSEMPEQEHGLLEGFQLWVNLPADRKMVDPSYQEFSASQVPVEQWKNGTEIRVISGRTAKGTVGPVKNDYVTPLFMDVSLPEGEVFEQSINITDNTFIYVIFGELLIGGMSQHLSAKHLGVFEQGELVQVKSASMQTRFILVSAQPLNEPIARGGPFVMNTQAQITQAFDDFKNNRF